MHAEGTFPWFEVEVYTPQVSARLRGVLKRVYCKCASPLLVGAGNSVYFPAVKTARYAKKHGNKFFPYFF
jgi:hypothetical protein